MQMSEWVELVQVQQALWINATFPEEAVVVQYEFVRHVPYRPALAAVKALAARETSRRTPRRSRRRLMSS